MKLSKMASMLRFISRLENSSDHKDPARRRFLQLAGYSALAGALAPFLLRLVSSDGQTDIQKPFMRPTVYEDLRISEIELEESIELIRSAGTLSGIPSNIKGSESVDGHLVKVRHFEHHFIDDFYMSEKQMSVLLDTYSRIGRVQVKVGHGNFNVLSFDQMLWWAERYQEVGAFTLAEKNFMDMIFHEDARRYGFLGSKLNTSLTERIHQSALHKISGTGQRLYKGQSEKLFRKVEKDIGKDLILTSGVRGIPKQLNLFMAKAILARGNLSRASRSLAPPGYSWHGVGDFDVGKRDYGLRNFSSEFTETREYKKLSALGYVKARYPEDNLLGVRFEPWHISVS